MKRTGCAGDQETRLSALCEAKHVESAHERSLDGLHGVELVVGWRRGAGKVIDFCRTSVMFPVLKIQ